MAGSASSSKRVWRSSLFAPLVLSACAAACGRGRAETSRPHAAIDASVAGATAPANEEPPRDAGTADASAAYASAAPVSGKSVGHTSVVFKLGLEGGATVAYKPRSTRGDHRYR